MTRALHHVVGKDDEDGFLTRLFGRDMESAGWRVVLAGPPPDAGLGGLETLFVPANDFGAEEDEDEEEDEDSPFDEELFWALMARGRRPRR